MNLANTVVVIPTLNEQDRIASVINGLIEANPTLDIWVFDGGSQDNTTAIVADIESQCENLILFHNPGRTQAQAVNRAALMANAAQKQVLIRMDAHAIYPDDFVMRLLDALNSTKADSVVVPLFSAGFTPWQTAAADLQNSWLGNGGAAHRTGSVSGFVTHGHHAAFRLDRFLSVGGYDVDFIANEDAEFDIRLTDCRGRIFLDNQNVVTYLPRATPIALYQQMYRNGQACVKTAFKHQAWLGPRQQLVSLAMLLTVVSLVGGVVGPLVTLVPAATYFTTVAILAGVACASLSPARYLRIVALAILSHFGFGLGILVGLIHHIPAVLLPRPMLGNAPK